MKVKIKEVNIEQSRTLVEEPESRENTIDLSRENTIDLECKLVDNITKEMDKHKKQSDEHFMNIIAPYQIK